MFTLVEETTGLLGTVTAFPCDICDPAMVNRTVKAITHDLGRIDLAVLNAGTHQPMRAHEFNSDVFRKLIEINVMGTVHCLEALIPMMIANRAGHIAVVSSVAGYRGLPTSAAYGLTKAGLINMTEALAPELQQHGVRLQIVNPGFIKTPLTDRNDYPMPFLMDVDTAADRFYRGLMSNVFEIRFPMFGWFMLLYCVLPNKVMLMLARKIIPESK